MALQRVWSGYWGVLAERSSPFDPGSLIDAWAMPFASSFSSTAASLWRSRRSSFPVRRADAPYLARWVPLEWHLAPKEVRTP